MSRFPRPLLALSAVSLLLLGPTSPPSAEAAGVPGVRVDLLIDGQLAREYYANQRIYVEAKKGRPYAIRLSNDTAGRVAVALAVDGLNTIDASHTAARDASKWVLGPYESVTVNGWQVSGSRARQFVFTSEERSYGAWLGDKRNLGMVSAVAFAERQPCCRDQDSWWGAADGAPADQRSAEEARGRSSRRAGDDDDREAAGASRAPAEPAPPIKKRRRDTTDRDASGASSTPLQPAPRAKKSVERAATGSGRRLANDVQWTQFDLDPNPLGSVNLRYGFRDELVELGVLAPPRRDIDRREAAVGFAPDPGSRCCR